jgi:hypothetical protein
MNNLYLFSVLNVVVTLLTWFGTYTCYVFIILDARNWHGTKRVSNLRFLQTRWELDLRSDLFHVWETNHLPTSLLVSRLVSLAGRPHGEARANSTFNRWERTCRHPCQGTHLRNGTRFLAWNCLSLALKDGESTSAKAKRIVALQILWGYLRWGRNDQTGKNVLWYVFIMTIKLNNYVIKICDWHEFIILCRHKIHSRININPSIQTPPIVTLSRDNIFKFFYPS